MTDQPQHLPDAASLARQVASGTVRLTVADADAMEQLGRLLATQLGAGDLVVLTGELGAGKTTLTRGLGEALGVRGPITSPTFVLARTHPSLGDGPPLVHVDAYRLGSALELDDLDIDFAASVVVVEWGAGLIEAEVDSWLEVVIDRPTGASGADEGSGFTGAGGADPASGSTGAGGADEASGSTADAARAAQDAAAPHAEDLDEPRTVTLRRVNRGG